MVADQQSQVHQPRSMCNLMMLQWAPRLGCPQVSARLSGSVNWGRCRGRGQHWAQVASVAVRSQKTLSPPQTIYLPIVWYCTSNQIQIPDCHLQESEVIWLPAQLSHVFSYRTPPHYPPELLLPLVIFSHLKAFAFAIPSARHAPHRHPLHGWSILIIQVSSVLIQSL